MAVSCVLQVLQAQVSEGLKAMLSSETMDIPDRVKIRIKAKIIEVESPRGKLSRNFKQLNIDFHLVSDDSTGNGNGKRKLKIDAWFGSRGSSAAIRTTLSHVENFITGVTKGYRYKMRFVYAHFPINASITNANNAIQIRHFLGEKKKYHVKNKDIRKFLDGIYVSEKGTIADED